MKPRPDACKKLCQPFLSLKSDVEDLKRQINERKKIERAKGLIMKRKGLNEDAAHQFLQALSQMESKKLVEIADAIIVLESIENSTDLVSSNKAS